MPARFGGPLPPRHPTPSSATLLATARAGARGRRLRLRYVGANGELTEREVDVLGLAFRDDHWLLAAYCHLRHGLRLFRIDRVRSARVTRRRAGRRGVPSFDAGAFAAVSWLDPGTGVPTLATVRLAADLAPAWGTLFPKGLSELLPDGARLCHVRASRIGALAALAASLGDRAELVHPRAARPRQPPPPTPQAPGREPIR